MLAVVITWCFLIGIFCVFGYIVLVGFTTVLGLVLGVISLVFNSLKWVVDHLANKLT